MRDGRLAGCKALTRYLSSAENSCEGSDEPQQLSRPTNQTYGDEWCTVSGTHGHPIVDLLQMERPGDHKYKMLSLAEIEGRSLYP